MALEGEREEDFRGNPLQPKDRRVLEPELPVILRVSHNATPRGAKVLLKLRESFLNQGCADTLPMILRYYGDGAESVPVECSVRNCHWGERDMTNDLVVQLCYQGLRESLCSA